jgi:hypothetical protein
MNDMENQSFEAKCDCCEKTFMAQGLVGGKTICKKCYPIWFKGILDERKDWEFWTGKTFQEMYQDCGGPEADGGKQMRN